MFTRRVLLTALGLSLTSATGFAATSGKKKPKAKTTRKGKSKATKPKAPPKPADGQPNPAP